MAHIQNQSLESELYSLVQPGRIVLVYQLPPELPGTLQTPHRPCLRGPASDLFHGEWIRPDGREPVAVKHLTLRGPRIDEDRFRTRIKREAVIWTALKHRNIVPFLGYRILHGSPVLVSPWCPQGDLSDYMHSNQSITRGEKVRLLRDAAQGLVYLHGLNPQIVHGGIKPENVIITQGNVAALCDIGMSRILASQDREAGLGRSSEGSSTINGYQAKEILKDDLATPASDVYAFGGLTLAAMSGKHPFWMLPMVMTILAIVNDETPQPEDHPALPASDSLWALLRDCWKGEVGCRPPMFEVLERLESDWEYYYGRSKTASSPSPKPSVREEESAVRPGYEDLTCNIPPPLPGKLTKIREPSTRGAYGDVYYGTWAPPDGAAKSVAIKCIRQSGEGLSDRLITRVLREVVIWNMVKHPNILPFIGYQIIDEVPMLVSPWCKNGNLASYIKNHPDLTRSDKLKFICGAARGLIHLHSLEPSIFHGDIKPQNVIVQDDLEAVLCDFGISRIILDIEQHTGMTTTEGFSGTSGYQAKEILNDDPLTKAADIYSFGGLILAVMSGKAPFWTKKKMGKTTAISLGEKPEWKDHTLLPETDPLWNLMGECWNADPGSRPSMPDVLQRLEADMTPH